VDGEAGRPELGDAFGHALLDRAAGVASPLVVERRLAGRLGIAVPGKTWPALVNAASFGQMRANAGRLAPDPAGVLNDRRAFFRRGSSGAGRELLSSGELAYYHARIAQLAPADC
jgi:aryl sulfotransferase